MINYEVMKIQNRIEELRKGCGKGLKESKRNSGGQVLICCDWERCPECELKIQTTKQTLKEVEEND